MVSVQHLASRLDSPAPESTVISRYRPHKLAVDGHVADRDRIQFCLFRQPLFIRHQVVLRQVDISHHLGFGKC